MVCLGLEPGAAVLKAHCPLSYGGTPVSILGPVINVLQDRALVEGFLLAG